MRALLEWLANWTPALILAAGSAALSVWATRRQAQVQTESANEVAPMQAMQTLVQQALAEAAAARGQVTTLMDNHLAHDREDRDRLIKVLTVQEETLRQIVGELVEHRQEERERTGAFHERLNAISTGIARLDARSGQ